MITGQICPFSLVAQVPGKHCFRLASDEWEPAGLRKARKCAEDFLIAILEKHIAA